MFEMKQLQYFVRCAEEQNLSRAAESLYTSQPHVSMVIRALEQELGTALFTREARGVLLTPAGQRVYTYAKQILRNMDLLEAAGREGGRQALSLVTNPSSNMAVLFAHFVDEHVAQNYQYRYSEGSVDTVLARVASGDAGLGFVTLPLSQVSAFSYMLERRKLAFTGLLDTEIVLYVGEKNPLRGRRSIRIAELPQLRFVQEKEDYFSIYSLLGGTSVATSAQAEVTKGSGARTDKRTGQRLFLRKDVTTDSDHVMIQMLKHTDYCNIGSYWFRNNYRQYNFDRIPIEDCHEKLRFGYITGQGRTLTTPEQEFLDYVQAAVTAERTG